ncbi:hypothetical protein [Massilia sp. GCM10023247]|uniref:hypothetical protein n=1 Tax=Massilia sp. GCM10023247 TaxID=3252643 RepID=UPI003617E380
MKLLQDVVWNATFSDGKFLFGVGRPRPQAPAHARHHMKIRERIFHEINIFEIFFRLYRLSLQDWMGIQ